VLTLCIAAHAKLCKAVAAQHALASARLFNYTFSFHTLLRLQPPRG